MTIHATFNPIGSTNPKDLIDNAQNLDYLILGPAPNYLDRRNVSRLSWAGIEVSFAAAQTQRDLAFQTQMETMGYELPALAYATGLNIARVTQIILYSGEFYRAKAGVVPFTTTGTWAADSTKLVSVGDAALRQEVANKVDVTQGLAKVGTEQFGMGRPGGATPIERGFWPDVGAGANVWRFRDRVLIGDAVDQDGKKNPSPRSWVGLEAAGYMTYFDSRSQAEIVSTIGGIGAAFASRSSDNVLAGELNTIGAGSYVNNDNLNTSDKKSAWAYYGHAVQKEPNFFTACMEVDICNSQAYVSVSPYQMGAPGTTAAHWIGVGGETAQSGLSSQPASVALAVVSTGPRNAAAGTGSLFGKGLVFQSDALAGCDGVNGSAIAVEMARGHRINWLTPTNGYAAHIRSDNNTTANATSIVFANGGFTIRGLKPDQVTEQNLFAVTPSANAANYLQVEPAPTGVPVVLRAQGTDTDIDMELFPKGAGVVRLGYNVISAAVPANFSAQQMLKIKDATGSTYYIPCRAGTW